MQEQQNLKCLLPKTEKLLIKLQNSCPFLYKYILVGGSALAIHLCHRQSEDLDFFTFDGGFDKVEIFDFISKFKKKEIVNQTDEQIDIMIDGVKVTFFDASWQFLKPKTKQNLNIATIKDIAAMKINVMFLRAKYRDYYDIYFIVKNCLSLKEIFEHSKHIASGTTFKLFAVALVYIDDIEDDEIKHLNPIENTDKKKIRDFFQQKLKQL